MQLALFNYRVREKQAACVCGDVGRKKERERDKGSVVVVSAQVGRGDAIMGTYYSSTTTTAAATTAT